MLYMLFNVSCNHSLKKSQIETKRVGNKRKSLQLQEVFPCAAHLSSLKKLVLLYHLVTEVAEDKPKDLEGLTGM